MTKVKSILRIVVAALLALSVLFALHAGVYKVYADDAGTEDGAQTAEEITPRGIFTSLSLAINGENGVITATAKNDITIFPSTVKVIVELYASPTYQEHYYDMILKDRNSTPDLNMGETISASCSTYGQQLYWMARMYYRIDSKDYEEKLTSVFLYDADGNNLGL